MQRITAECRGIMGIAGPSLLIRNEGLFFPSSPRSVDFTLQILDFLDILYRTQLRINHRCFIVKLHRQTASHYTTIRLILPSGERHKARPLSVRITECEWHTRCFCFFLAYLYPIHQLCMYECSRLESRSASSLDEASNEVHEQRGCLCRRSRQRNRRRL